MSGERPIAQLLAQARAAGVRAHLRADGSVDLHGPPSAFALGRALRERQDEVASELRREALDGFHRALGWKPMSPRTQDSLDLGDTVPRTASGHALPPPGRRGRAWAGAGAANARQEHREQGGETSAAPGSSTDAAKRGAG